MPQNLLPDSFTANISADWLDLLDMASSSLDRVHVDELAASAGSWLPKEPSDLFASLRHIEPDRVRALLIGESPYPRPGSANGIAFWDASVSSIWGTGGLSAPVNRATSLRNFIKMLLTAEGLLKPGQSRSSDIKAIAPQKDHVTTLGQLFANMFGNGIMPLNMTPVLRPDGAGRWSHSRSEERLWRPFMERLLALLTERLQQQNIKPTVILFGQTAQTILRSATALNLPHLSAEHPYNVTFITNPTVLDYFRPYNLLRKGGAV